MQYFQSTRPPSQHPAFSLVTPFLHLVKVDFPCDVFGLTDNACKLASSQWCPFVCLGADVGLLQACPPLFFGKAQSCLRQEKNVQWDETYCHMSISFDPVAHLWKQRQSAVFKCIIATQSTPSAICLSPLSIFHWLCRDTSTFGSSLSPRCTTARTTSAWLPP